MSEAVCRTCGVLVEDERYVARLWDLHGRRADGRQYGRGLAFTGEWLDEHVCDEEDMETLNLVMERDMAARGLCPSCGLPDLRNAEIISEEDARELWEMHAEQAAELRAGC
jgi:hypothetical protein